MPDLPPGVGAAVKSGAGSSGLPPGVGAALQSTQAPQPEETPSMWHFLGQDALQTLKNLPHAVGLPGFSKEEWKQANEAENRKTAGERLKEGGLGLLKSSFAPAIAGYDILSGTGKEAWRGVKGAATGDPMAGLHLAASLNPFAAPVISQMSEQGLGSPEANVTGISNAALLALGTKAPEATTTAKTLFKQNLAETAHDMLNTAQGSASRELWAAHGKVSQQVGKLGQGLNAADLVASGGKPTVATSDLVPKLGELADSYRLHEQSPGFNKAVQAVQDQSGQAFLKDVLDLRNRVGRLYAKAGEGTPEKAALGDLYETLGKKAQTRATEIGQADQLTAHDKLWKTLRGYEDASQPVGKLLNAPTGQSFFSILRDPANGAELKRASADLEQFGLPEGYFKQLVKDHQALHNYVNDRPQKGFSVSKIKAMAKHPVVGTAGFVGGHAAGTLVGSPWIGGIVGGVGAAALADRLAAARAIGRMGGAPEVAGRFGSAPSVEPYQPTGEVPEPQRGGARPPAAATPDPGTQAIQDVAAALQDQYPKLPKTEALAKAKAAVAAAGPDFNAAFKQAMRGPQAVSGGSPQAELAAGVRQAQGDVLRGSQSQYAPGPSTKGAGTGKGLENMSPAELQEMADQIRQAQKAQGKAKRQKGVEDQGGGR